MYDSAAVQSGALEPGLHRHMRKTPSGKIKISARNKSSLVVKYTMLALIALTVVGFLTFNYKNIDFADAVSSTLHNIKVVFLEPKLSHSTITKALYDLLVTFCLGILATFFGALIAIFASLLCAKNIARPAIAAVAKSVVAFVRAVPTILWVLIFAVSAGLGSVAAVAGLTFHSAGYLTKAYAESIEEMDYGTIEALKACGASYWQIVFQAIWPSSISYMLAWTFMRFEINFVNAIAVGAAAGSGGIGYSLWMAGAFYFDLHEMGFITYIVVASVILLEILATKIKSKVK
ncbi:phosphonate transport system permease protein [Sporobacter termitidis DSM 10068]|uniref:Phosphonate transport system permease protein n=1 Tax=Sporobacter termitidis DSM 10068 TaxID=1123282 RepID=A0A1M5Z7Y3_9FIRM|nr:ABC transporter permease subunit [Sporobacter termitidis]SHI20198.1 phosphonate transport system permease protein [Sporobacter termitidis DSM 10068]